MNEGLDSNQLDIAGSIFMYENQCSPLLPFSLTFETSHNTLHQSGKLGHGRKQQQQQQQQQQKIIGNNMD